MIMHKRAACATALAAASCVLSATAAAQTAVKLPKNKFTPQQDVEIGQKAAAEVRKQYPIIHNDAIQSYLTGVGERLVAAAPADLKQPVYQYSFTPVNLKEINAFALPGGPMFVHRGMIEAAGSEAEVAGVMAHELSHVLLRHGTANQTKAENPWLQIGQIAGAIGGAVVGGAAGSAIAEGSQFGLGTLMLRYSRDFEKQADLMGAQIMARAGYDPRALAHMFETIEKESQAGGGNPQWLSDHPNPGNRSEYINKEAAALTLASAADMTGFEPVKTAFASMPPAMTMAQLAKAKNPSGNASSLDTGTPGEPVAPGSTQYRGINAGVFQAAVPSNWHIVSSSSSIRATPQNGYGQRDGQTVFSHGVEFGVAAATSRDLQEATTGLLNAFARDNPDLQLAGDQKLLKVSQRSAIGTPLVDRSPLGGREIIGLYTTFLADGHLFYFLTVVPEGDAAAFRDTFRHVWESIRLTDAR